MGKSVLSEESGNKDKVEKGTRRMGTILLGHRSSFSTISRVPGRNVSSKNHDLRLDAQTRWSVARDMWVDKGAVWAHVLLCVRIVQHEDGDIFGCHALVVEPAVVLIVADFRNLVREMWVDH